MITYYIPRVAEQFRHKYGDFPLGGAQPLKGFIDFVQPNQRQAVKDLNPKESITVNAHFTSDGKQPVPLEVTRCAE